MLSFAAAAGRRQSSSAQRRLTVRLGWSERTESERLQVQMFVD